MPGPDPNSIWLELGYGCRYIMYHRYLSTGQAGNRKKRVERLAKRMAKGDWICRWCKDPLPLWRRVDALYCRESCRKRAVRGRQKGWGNLR